jgi:hypothetical protein
MNRSSQAIYHFLTAMVIVALAGCQCEDQLLPYTLPKPTFSISGTVYVHGVGAAGATVSYGTRTVVTDPNGVYMFTDVPNGEYTLRASLGNLRFMPKEDFLRLC